MILRVNFTKLLKVYLAAFIFLILSGNLFSQVNYDDYEKSNAHNNKALNDIKLKDFHSAEQEILTALSIDSLNRNSYINLNLACSATGNFELLLDWLLRGRQIFQEDDEICYYIGNAYQRLGKVDSALANYSLAIKYSKLNGEDYPIVYAYYLNRGVCFSKVGRYDLALADFNYAIKLNGSKSSIYANRGNAYLQLKMSEEACKDWHKAMELGEKSVEKYVDKFCTN